MRPEVANIVGFVGMAFIIGAYAYLTASKAPNPFLLHGANLLGATLLVLSLLVNTNLPALLLEAIWAAVAVWGLSKAVMARRSPSRSREGLAVGQSDTGDTRPPPSPLPHAGGGE